MLMAKGSALVSGEQVGADMTMVTVRVLRGFFYKGQPVAAGTIAAFPSLLVMEMLSIKRVEPWVEPPPPPSPANIQLTGALTVSTVTPDVTQNPSPTKGGTRHAK